MATKRFCDRCGMEIVSGEKFWNVIIGKGAYISEYKNELCGECKNGLDRWYNNPIEDGSK